MPVFLGEVVKVFPPVEAYRLLVLWMYIKTKKRLPARMSACYSNEMPKDLRGIPLVPRGVFRASLETPIETNSGNETDGNTFDL